MKVGAMNPAGLQLTSQLVRTSFEISQPATKAWLSHLSAWLQ